MTAPSKRRGPAVSYANPAEPLNRFDYAVAAEVFTTRGKPTRWTPVNYRRFATAAEAIRYAVEELPPPALLGAVLEVSEDRFDHKGIRALYDRPGYPLPRLGEGAAPKKGSDGSL